MVLAVLLVDFPLFLSIPFMQWTLSKWNGAVNLSDVQHVCFMLSFNHHKSEW